MLGNRATHLATMIALASAAFGIIAALAWNTFITDLIKVFLPAKQGLLPELLYAVLITLVAIWVMSTLGNVAERSGGKSAM